nr:citramalate synthase [Spirochaetaceae bacterium]
HLQALLDSDAPVVTIVGKSWLAHVYSVLKTNPEENLAMIHDSVSFLSSRGREVIFDAEHFFDGFKEHPEYSMKVLKTANDAGASTLVPCDTNGGSILKDLEKAYNAIKDLGLSNVGIHLHNDTGMAVAGSLLAVDYGFNHIQGTMNGWGERCGNTNLCTVIPNLALKMNKEVLVPGALEELTPFARYIAEVANLIPDKRLPYVGSAAFSHKAGQHADVIEKDATIMEHIPSEKVGNTRQIVLSELAGKSTIVHKLKPYGTFDKKSPEVHALITELKTREQLGYEYEAAEASFDLIIRKTLGLYKPLFELTNYHMESFKSADESSKTITRLFLNLNGRQVMGAGTGIGPVGTLDHALRDALEPSYPFLKKLKLVDYKVRVLNPSEASESQVRVFVSTYDGNRTWDTVGVHHNIIEASWIALIDSFEYYYNAILQDD